MAVQLANVRVGADVHQASGTTIALPYPTGVRSDDLLIGFVDANSTTLVTTPAGYTLANRATLIGNTAVPGYSMFYKQAAGGESGTLSVTLPNVVASGVMIAVPDIDLVAILDVALQTADQNLAQSACDFTTKTTLVDKVLAVCGVINTSTGNTWTPPTIGGVLMTEAWDSVSSGSTRAGELSYGLCGAAGATGTVTATASGSAKSCGVLLFLKPGPPRAGLFA